MIGLWDDRSDRDPDALLRRLAGRGEVEHAGALVQLSDKHASVLTDRVIARFADGVDDDAAAAARQAQAVARWSASADNVPQRRA